MADGKLLDPDMQARRIASLQSTNPAQPDAPQYGLAIAKFGALYGIPVKFRASIPSLAPTPKTK